MIVLLSQDPGLRNAWQRFWRRGAVREVEALGEGVLLVHPGQKPQWRKLERRLGRYAGRLVPSGVALPGERPWRNLDLGPAREKVLGNTLCAQEEQQRWVGLYDPQGRHCVLAWELAQHFPRVSVYCRQRERYQPLQESLLDQLGALLELSASWEALLDCPLVGALEPPEPQLRWRGLLLYPGSGARPREEGRLGQDLQLLIPAEVRAICPGDVDPRDLYLAILQSRRSPLLEELRYILPRDPAQCGAI